MSSFAADLKPVPTRDELVAASKWVSEQFVRSNSPVSFVYDGQPSSTLLSNWRFQESTRNLDRDRTQRTQVYTDPATGLQLRVVLVQYKDFPTVEWTAYLKNTGAKDTPIVKDLQALDVIVTKPSDAGDFILHHNRGTPCTAADYEPFATLLGPGTEKRITGAGGRPTNTDLCYFNLEYGALRQAQDGSQGMIIALGWPGQIATSFTRGSSDNIRIMSGQEQTHFKLLPGEEVRTPLVAVQFWKGGDVVRAQNIWRRWMIAHNLERPGGKPMPNVFSTCATDLFPGYVGNQEAELAVLEAWKKKCPQIDYWWIDAGWYPCGDNWWRTGTWEVDRSRYPGGIKAVSDAAHAAGMKLTVWFEPERVTEGSWLAQNHPEWILGGSLLNLGNPEAWKWVVEQVDGIIVDNGIDMYRQDFNMDPLGPWRSNDAEDRQGITEIKHVMGLLAFWDELKRRHPDMPFDECASGGRRNDLEMMRRGVPLSKTDFGGGTSSTQCQTYGIASWLPYFGAGAAYLKDVYTLRSNFAPWTATCEDTRVEGKDLSLTHQFVAEAKKVMPYMFGDFYPLTPYSLEENVWMAWQFDLSEQGKGIVQAFRRPENGDESMTFKLHALDPKATYELADFDSSGTIQMSGRELMDSGLAITTKQKPWASIIAYKKL